MFLLFHFKRMFFFCITSVYGLQVISAVNPSLSIAEEPGGDLSMDGVSVYHLTEVLMKKTESRLAKVNNAQISCSFFSVDGYVNFALFLSAKFLCFRRVIADSISCAHPVRSRVNPV